MNIQDFINKWREKEVDKLYGLRTLPVPISPPCYTYPLGAYVSFTEEQKTYIRTMVEDEVDAKIVRAFRRMLSGEENTPVR